MNLARLYGVIMAGGASSRLWPKSRDSYPKWMFSFGTGRNLLQMAYDRAAALISAERLLVITAAAQAELVRQCLPELPSENVIVEPQPRDTAGCVALATGLVLAYSKDATMLVLPGDHIISPLERFCAAVRTAVEVANAHAMLLTLGILPTKPATQYGYIQRGASLGLAYRAAAFKEKPDEITAAKYCASGEYYWNSGIFIWRADAVLEVMSKHLPEHAAGVRALTQAARQERPAAIQKMYAKIPKISVDYGVMEQAGAEDQVAVVPADFEWDDVGSWSAVAAHLPKDASGNALAAKLLSLNARECVVVAPEGKTVVAVSVEDLAIIDTPDALLVCPRNMDQEVKRAVSILRKQGRSEIL